MNARFSPSVAHGTVSAPPAKSVGHRLLIGAALAQEESILRGLAVNDDIAATLDGIRALGAIATVDGDRVTVMGIGPNKPNPAVFPCRESGSTLRFLLPIALTNGGGTFTGSARLMERCAASVPSFPAVSVTHTAQSLTVRGTLTPGIFQLRGDISSQCISGMLFALPLLAGDSLLRILPPVESRPYIDLTAHTLRRFGIALTAQADGCFSVPGRQSYRPIDVTVEGDWSNGAALLAFGGVRVDGLSGESAQGDRVFPEISAQLDAGSPTVSLADTPDLGPILFAYAALRHGATFTAIRRLRLKESDRVSAMATELAKFGVRMTLSENECTVFPGGLHAPSTLLSAHNDHRIVMALALLCSRYGGEIAGAEAVNKSFPAYFDALRALGVDVDCR